MINEVERQLEWEAKLRALWLQEGQDMRRFISSVAFSLTLRDIDIANYKEWSLEVAKESLDKQRKAKLLTKSKSVL